MEESLMGRILPPTWCNTNLLTPEARMGRYRYQEAVKWLGIVGGRRRICAEEPQEIWSLCVWGRKIPRTVTLPVIPLQSSSRPVNVLASEQSSESAAQYPG